MKSFKEWLVVREAGLAQHITGFEDIPDTSPEEGQIVILMDKDKAAITNDDLFLVVQKSPDEIMMLPKTAIEKRNPNMGIQMRIARPEWHNFTLVNHNLTPAEKRKFGNKPTWMIGSNKDKWIKNRTKKPMATATQDDISPLQVAKFRAQLQGDSGSEDQQVSAARSWLTGK